MVPGFDLAQHDVDVGSRELVARGLSDGSGLGFHSRRMFVSSPS